jgi:hypothetical protein
MTTTTVDTQQLQQITVTPCPPSTTTWSTIGNQFIPLSQASETQSFQQIRPQMDVLLSQNYRQSSQLSSQLSTQNTTQSDFIIPNTQNDDLINKLSSKSYTTLNSLQPTVDTIDNSVFTANNININSNTNNNNNNITDEVMEKFDSLGLDIDTSELLSDINFNSMSIMSVMLDSGPNLNLSLNSRDNLVSSTLQTPQPLDLNEESTRNLMASPQQMQRLQNKLMFLETNNNNNNNNNSNNNNNNDIQRMD